ncbi:hypothetical protein Pcinc_019268 [Petrolisthes cinctipes]|uniref:Uncharacterized protein n=1 Tax=Petrolisthes cinctipes TaxID=88211 RepID=A0AAE1KKN5_PETCI|nr:hypothetical protein Pcinc_019268 [Petrolisthes cinctipes]
MGELREVKEKGSDKMNGDHQGKDDGYCGDRGKNRSPRGSRRGERTSTEAGDMGEVGDISEAGEVGEAGDTG